MALKARYSHSELPYTPIAAKDLGQDDELAEIARRHLEATGPGSLRAEIPFLRLQCQSNLQAAYNLLDDTNEGKVSRNTCIHARNLYNLEKANDLEQSAESAEKLHAYLQPDSGHANDPELAMTFTIAKIAVHVTKSRQQGHSHEFRVRGREFLHFKAVIGLQLEALEDYRNRSHNGFFVRKLLGGPKKKQPQRRQENKRQESDDEDGSDDVRPMVKKRRVDSISRIAAVPKKRDSDKRDDNADVGTATHEQPIVDHLNQQETQGLGRHSGRHLSLSAPQYSGRNGEIEQANETQSASSDAVQLLPEQGVSTGSRARRTRRPIITAPCTTCGKEIPCGPFKQSKQCVACQREARKLSVVHQQAPAPTAVMVAPTAIMVPPRFAPTAVMVAPTAPVITRAAAIEKVSHDTLIRDFAPSYEQALQLQSTQVQQGDKSKIEMLEQKIGNMSDFIAGKEGEIQGLRAMLSEQSRESARQKSELKAAHDEIIRLEARISQLEE